MKKLILTTITLSLTLQACTVTQRTLAAGAIGCPSDKIKVTNMHTRLDGSNEYTATCNGIAFNCSRVDAYSNVTCTKSLIQPKPTATEVAKQEGYGKEECLRRKKFNSLLKCD